MIKIFPEEVGGGVRKKVSRGSRWRTAEREVKSIAETTKHAPCLYFIR